MEIIVISQHRDFNTYLSLSQINGSLGKYFAVDLMRM